MTASIPHIRHPLAVLALVFLAVALAGCETVPYPSAPQAAAAPNQPMTRSRAATDCWMSTEKGHADINLDKRADIVTKCIDEKMKGGKG